METYQLTRTGDRPLTFEGEVIAEAGAMWVNQKEQLRWHEITLYRTGGGSYVLAIGYFTQWQGEQDHRAVYHAKDVEALMEELQMYDPLEHIMGYPPGDQYEERQARLERVVLANWAHLVSEILEGEEFAERIG